MNQIAQGTRIVLISSNNPSANGESVIFTASVAGGTDGNMVVFTIGGQTQPSSTLTGGITSCTVVLTEGSYLVSASYYDNAGSEIRSEASLTQVVIAENITVELISSNNPSIYGRNVSFTATVVGSATPPAGTITFRDGGKILKSLALSGDKASYSTNKLDVGSHVITATYDLTGDYGTINQVVEPKTKAAEIITDIHPEFESADLKVYPNPFDERLVFEFTTPETAYTRIEIYDMTGRHVETVFDQLAEAGIKYSAEFKPEKVISAMYIYRITMGEAIYIGKALYNNRN